MYDVSPFLLTGEPSTSQWLHVAFAIVGVTPATSIEPRWVQTQLTSCICCFVLHVATRNPLIFISSGNQFFSWHAYCTGIKHKLNTINLAKIQYYTYILMWNILRYQMADQHTHTQFMPHSLTNYTQQLHHKLRNFGSDKPGLTAKGKEENKNVVHLYLPENTAQAGCYRGKARAVSKRAVRITQNCSSVQPESIFYRWKVVWVMQLAFSHAGTKEPQTIHIKQRAWHVNTFRLRRSVAFCS